MALKAGEVQRAHGIYQRFGMYRRKSQATGYDVEYWPVGTKTEAHTVERQVGDTLKRMGEQLPWDVKANERWHGQKVPGVGLPWERKPFTVDMRFDDPENVKIEVR